MSGADASFPPDHEKLPFPRVSEDPLAFMTRVIGRLNDYEDHDLAIDVAVAATVAVRHNLGRVPSGFTVLWIDSPARVYAAMGTGWGYNVIYLTASANCNVRIRLR